ncbi:MAG: ATP-binding protein [Candidatus Sericytochromatia bacterium]
MAFIMLIDSTLLTVREFGIAFNTLGLAIPLLLFAVASRYWREPFFRLWALNYVFTLVTLTLEGRSAAMGHPFWLAWPAMALFVAASACLYSAAEQLRKRPVMNRWLASIIAVLVVGSGGLLLAQVHYLVVAIPVILFNVISHLVVGWAWIRFGRQGSRRFLPAFLGAWTMFTGLWAFAYVVLEPMNLIWVGAIVAGVNHLVLGAGVLIFMMEDVTHRLAEQNEKLLDMDRLKNEFLANVSHELRTPLSSIKAGTWLLQAGKYADSKAVSEEILAAIATNTDNLIHLIEDLLDYAKMGAGGMTFAIAPGDLAATVNQALQQSATLFEQKGLTLEADVPAHLDVAHDSVKIGQTVTNMLSNAIKFSPPGGRVTVRLRRHGEMARLEVEDTGPGIPAEQLEQVFDRFYQVDGSSTRKIGGTGLGLAICKAIVEDGHHGRIWAENGSEGGARVVVELPLEAAPRA